MRKCSITRLLFVSSLIVSFLYSQDNRPCSAPEANQFDFWTGVWQAEWEGGKGVNTIKKILGGCVIHEEFRAEGDNALLGNSNSVYIDRTEEWKQTWVDNQGAYLDFTGKWMDDRMVLSRSAKKDSSEFIQRMVWYNITETAFDWNWESSLDDGKTWKVNWKIRYTRK